MEAGAIRPGYELWRPNRVKAEAKSARALVVFLMLVTAALAFVIIIGGWTRLEGVKALTIVYAGLYVLFAFLVARWNRGVLPVAAALSIILAIFAGIAAPAWFDRAKDGLSDPALPPDLLGILCLLLVPLQVILIAVAMVAFNQDWHVEEERPIGDEIPPGNQPDEDEPRASRRSTRMSRTARSAVTRRPRKA
jgi:lysylphosphatidylglycerol synthetase-like protein (DUF2156 family)